MKTNLSKPCFGLLALVLFTSANAQLSFTFSASGGTFTPISGATTVIAANVDEELSSVQNIGFSFNYGCNSYTQFKASSNGWMSFGNTASETMFTNVLSTTGQGPILAPLWDDLATNGSTGKVSFVLSGSAPNRVLTVEWLNMKWDYNASNARISFQVKLYETTNIVEFIYDALSGSLSSPSASIGVCGGSSATDFYSLNGSGASPTANYGTETNSISSKPADNQLYRFTPQSMSYTSSTVTQNSSSASKCDINQQIIGLQVVMGGGCMNQLSLTQLLINMTGSTIPGTNTNDVTRIRVYYTGNSSTFMPISEFVAGGIAPSTGTITFNGSQPLLPGTNYFWISYDMNSSTATIANLLDAQCTQITVGGVNRVPSVTSPVGTRTIAACTVAPGGASNALAFWMKANAGTSTTTNATTFTTWNDQSGNGRNAIAPSSAQSPTYYDNATNNINFNPVVDFDDAGQSTTNGDYMDIPSNGILATGSNPYVAYFILKPGTANATTPGKFLFSGDVGTNTFNAFDIRSSYRYNDSWNSNDLLVPNQWSPNVASMSAFNYNNSVREMFVGGASVGSMTTSTVRNSSGLNSAIGVQRSAATLFEYYDGNIAEMITYPYASHSEETRYRIESYLATKYGMTLPHNYVSSTGTTVWNLAVNASYNNNIIGLARDDNSAFSQKQSKSTATTPDMLTLYIGPTKQTNQANNTGSFTSGDQSFFYAGHNGDPYMYAWGTTEKPVSIHNRLRREWLSQKTNFTNTDLKIQFDFNLIAPGYSALNVADLCLLTDADGDFTNASILTSPTINFSVSSGVVTVTVPASSFTGTPYFTLGSLANTTPLPVRFTNYSVECINNQVDINWSAEEEGNDVYGIERSSDGVNFELIATVKKNNNGQMTQPYNWKDRSPLAGTSYYRIKTTDISGRPLYTKIATIKTCAVSQSFLENDNNSPAVLHVRLDGDAPVEINLYDAAGRQLELSFVTGKRELKQGYHRLVVTNASMAKGVYLISVRIDGHTSTHRLIKR